MESRIEKKEKGYSLSKRSAKMNTHAKKSDEEKR